MRHAASASVPALQFSSVFSIGRTLPDYRAGLTHPSVWSMTEASHARGGPFRVLHKSPTSHSPFPSVVIPLSATAPSWKELELSTLLIQLLSENPSLDLSPSSIFSKRLQVSAHCLLGLPKPLSDPETPPSVPFHSRSSEAIDTDIDFNYMMARNYKDLGNKPQSNKYKDRPQPGGNTSNMRQPLHPRVHR